MKKSIYFIAAIFALIFSACEKDGEMLTATLNGNGTQIGSADDNIVLTLGNASGLALTIYWDELGNATLSNPDAQATDDLVVNAVQFSLTSDFTNYIEDRVDNDAAFVQYTVAELNNIVTELGVEGGQATPVYIRMRTTLGTSSGTVYGNYITVTVTPYFIDMSSLRLAGVANGAYTGAETSIPAVNDGTDGAYAGFARIPGEWWNFFFIAGNGSIYGSDETDGPFILDQKNDISSWNVWFPQPSGCYYIDINVTDLEWECTSISGMTLSVAGGEPLTMIYSTSNVAYYTVFNTTEAGSAIQVEYTGTLYNYELTTSSEQTVTFPVVCDADGSIAPGAAGASSGVTTAAAGTYTLIVYAGENRWELHEGNYDLGGGGVESPWPEDNDYSSYDGEVLYIYNLSDQTPSSVAGTLTRTSTGVYEGFFYMNGWYNFKFGDSEDPASASIVYGSAPTSTDGALYRLFCGPTMYNIWWNSGDAGFVYITVNTNERSWSYTDVSSIAVTGDFNGWSLDSDLLTLGTDGLWTADITPGSWGEWGIQFILNGDWSWAFAPASDGTIFQSSSASLPGTAAEPGVTYTLTLDLAGMTYSIVEQGSVAPTYDEYLYVFYTWPSDGYWQERLASVLYSPEGNGIYSGFFSSGNSWSTAEGWASPYVNYTFGSSSTGNSGTKYLVVDNATLSTESGSNGWLSGLGITELTVDLTAMTVTNSYIGGATVVNSSTGTGTAMAFDDSANFVWEATVTFAEGESFTISLGESYSLGGSDGILTQDGGSISVGAAGTYLVTVDLSNASALTYSIELQ